MWGLRQLLLAICESIISIPFFYMPCNLRQSGQSVQQATSKYQNQCQWGPAMRHAALAKSPFECILMGGNAYQIFNSILGQAFSNSCCMWQPPPPSPASPQGQVQLKVLFEQRTLECHLRFVFDCLPNQNLFATLNKILFDTKLICIVWEMCRYIYLRYFNLLQVKANLFCSSHLFINHFTL